MKKIIVLVILVLILAGGAAYLLTKDNSSDNKANNAKDGAVKLSEKQGEACKLFTAADAKKVLGETAKANNVTLPDNNQNKDVTGSTCNYSTEAKTPADIPNVRSATIMMRIPLTDAGKKDNNSQFKTLKPVDEATNVTGYGESAFWNPAFGQLNILVNDTWLMISNGSGAPNNRSLDDAKKVADIVVPKLQN